MKVAMVVEWFDTKAGGVTVHVKHLTEFLTKYGVEVEIISSSWKDMDAGVPVHRIKGPKDPFFRLNVSPWASRDMRKIIEKGNFDVVHAHHAFSRTPLSALHIARELGIRAVLTTHTVSFMPDYEYLWSALSYSYPVYRIMLSKADRIIAVSSAAEHFISYFTDVPITVIPNGVDTSFFKPLSKEYAREQMGFDPSPSFLYVGRLVSKKGLFTLLLAFRSVKKEIPDARLRIAGKGRLKAVLSSMAKAIGIAESVEFLGYVPDEKMNALFTSADIFVLPSSFGESFGIVLLEAMASGTPVIGTRVGGIEEILGGGRYGVLVPPSDPEELSEAMIKLMKDEEKRKIIAERALKRVRSEYDWRVVVKKVIKVYEESDVR